MTLSTYFNKIHTLVFIFLFTSYISWGQINKEVEIGTYISSSGQNPFWLRTNQYGIVPLESQFITVRGQISKDYDSTTKKKINYGYGVSGVVNVGKINQFILPEFYVKTKWRAFEFYAGRRKEIVGLVDTTLTSGSYSWSGNAVPLPKIQLSIPNYTSILGKGLLSIKGSYAHGWFDNGFVKDFFLHQKSLYGRIGKPSWKLKFYGGLNHQVQWGGKPSVPFKELNTGRLIDSYPTGLSTYVKVVSGVSLSNGAELGGDGGVPLNEAWNRAGNHLGSLDIGMEFLTEKALVTVYRQSIYDDGSLYYLNNIADGLFGVSIQRKKQKTGVQRFLFEYLNTSNQGGILGGSATVPELRGVDNYFNNSLYLNGWTYQGYTIGTPFIVPKSNISTDLLLSKDVPAKIPESYLINNRTRTVHFALLSKMQNTLLESRITFSKNINNSYTTPISDNLFLFQRISFPSKKIQATTLSLDISVDLGSFYGNQFGVAFCLKRSWL